MLNQFHMQIINRIKEGLEGLIEMLSFTKGEVTFHDYNKDLVCFNGANTIFEFYKSEIYYILKKEEYDILSGTDNSTKISLLKIKEKDNPNELKKLEKLEKGMRWLDLEHEAATALKLSGGKVYNIINKTEFKPFFTKWLNCNFQIFTLLLKTMYFYKVGVKEKVRKIKDNHWKICQDKELLKRKYNPRTQKKEYPNYLSEKWEAFNLVEFEKGDLQKLGEIVIKYLYNETNSIKHLSENTNKSDNSGLNIDMKNFKARIKLKANISHQRIIVSSLSEGLQIINKHFHDKYASQTS